MRSLVSINPRSFMYIPAHSEKFINKIVSSPIKPDLACLDLEDGVALNQKDIALENAIETIQKYPEIRWGIRCNSDQWETELNKLPISAKQPLLPIVLPKVEFPDQISSVERFLRSKGHSNPDIFVMIETPMGLENIGAIFQHSRSIRAAIFGAEDFLSHYAIVRSDGEEELSWARGRILNACFAYNVHPIDAVCTQFKNPEKLLTECKTGVSIGFRGKQCIHPIQIETINSTFIPPASILIESKQIVQAFEEHQKNGSGAFSFDNRLIDRPEYEKAKNIVQRFELYNSL